MSAAMTYATLKTDIAAYAERSKDTAFVAQIPRFIMLAENRIASEARGLGFIMSVTDNMVVGTNGQALAKPSRWRETASIQIGTSSGFNKRVTLKLRSLEYCRYYAPDPTVLDQPRFYAEWDWAHFLIAPSPDLAYPYELIFFERPVPLDDSVSVNWTTQFAPQLLLNACLLEASAWVSNDEKMKRAQDAYDRALKQVEFESKRRLLDRVAGNTDAK